MIDERQPVRQRDMTQWIRLRGADPANPVLLLMQQGPGLPMLNEARRFGRLLGLEQAFTVVYWDQRGCGRSLRQAGPVEVTGDHMVDDTITLLELLRDRFDQPPIIAGFSFGATFAARAAVRRPDLVGGLVAVGMDIDIPAAEAHTYDFVLDTARRRGNRRAVRQLEKIGPPPHLDIRRFSTRVRWAANFGGVTTDHTYNGLLRILLASLLRSPDYSVADVVRTVRGITATQAALLTELWTTDLVRTMPRIEVPIVLAQGRLDQVAPAEPAQRFYDSVTAPGKRLVWFENSAHTPHLEEPGKFRQLLLEVRATQGATRAG